MAPPAASSSGNGGGSAKPRNAQARKRMNDDERPYIGASGLGGKRHAADKAEGDGRVKRKRIEGSGPSSVMNANGTGALQGMRSEEEPRESLMDFSQLPTNAIYRYLTHNNLIPHIYPSPLSAYDPLPPSSLLGPVRTMPEHRSPPPQITPANRPRRASRDNTGSARRRSARLQEDEGIDVEGRTPVLADVAGLHGVLAKIAQEDFVGNDVVREADILGMFVHKSTGEASRRI